MHYILLLISRYYFVVASVVDSIQSPYVYYFKNTMETFNPILT